MKTQRDDIKRLQQMKRNARKRYNTAFRRFDKATDFDTQNKHYAMVSLEDELMNQIQSVINSLLTREYYKRV